MFAATTHQVVKSLGKDTLTPVRSLDCADVSTFSIVIKERRRRLIFWKRTQCLTTEFKLDDILSSPLTDEDKAQWVSTRTLATFNYDTNFSLNGKFGADLHKELLDVDLEASDSVTVKSDLGELVKEEVDLQRFINATKGRTLDLQHPLVVPMLQDTSKTLCLVTGVVRLCKEASITGSTNVKASEEVEALADRIKEDGEGEEHKNKRLVMPGGTALAYSQYELQVSRETGRFSLVLHRSHRGGFLPSLSGDLDEPDGPSDAMGATALFQGIQTMEEEHRESLRQCTVSLIHSPCCLSPLSDLLHKAADFLEMSIEKTTTLQSLQNKMAGAGKPLMQFLHLAGFEHQEDDTVRYPQRSTEVFEACELLVSLLEELDDDELSVTAACLQQPPLAHGVIATLKPVWESEQCEVSLQGDQAWLSQPSGLRLMSVFAIQHHGNQLQVAPDNMMDTQALYLIVDAFMQTQ